MLEATAVGTWMGPTTRVDATSSSNGLPIQKRSTLATSTFGRVSSAAPSRLPCKDRTRLLVAFLLRWNPRPHMEKNVRRGI